MCGWVVGPCPCSDADQDGVCDDADDLCNPDGAAVICDALPPNCRPGTVPLVIQGCFANDCVSWDECAAGGHLSRDVVTMPTVTRVNGVTLVAVYLAFVEILRPYAGPMA